MCEVDWDLLIRLGTLVVATGTLIIGSFTLNKAFKEYYSSIQWKKAEFLAKEYKDFIEDDFVKKSFIILDGYQVKIPLSKGEIDGVNDFVDFKMEKLQKAFEPPWENNNCPVDEAYIRLYLDKFFYRLGVFQNHIDNGLLSKELVKPYLIYWIEMIGNKENKNIDISTKRFIWLFLKDYHYYSTIKLFNTFGYSMD